MDCKREQEFIKSRIKNGDTAPIIERAKRLITNLYPVTVVSYKNRYSKMYAYFEQEHIPFYVFVYDDDYTASGYDKYVFSYGQFVRITKEDFAKYNMFERGIGRKRFYVQKYMEDAGIQKYFMLDDDYEPTDCGFSIKRDENTGKSICIPTSMHNILKATQYMFEAYPELGIACPSHQWSNKSYRFTTPIIKSGHISGFFVCNGDILKEHDCYWTKETAFEDLEMAIQASIKNVPWGRFAPIVIKALQTCTKKSVISPERSDLAFNLYKLHPHCIEPKLIYSESLKQYTLVPHKTTTKFEKLSNPYDKDLYEYAMNHTLEEFMEYLKNDKS